MKLSRLVFFCLSFAGFVTFSLPAYSEGISVSESGGSFPLVANKAAATLVFDGNDAEVVKVATQAFSKDVNLLTGVTPTIKSVLDNPYSVIIGTLGSSTLIDQLASAGKIDRSRLEGKWETFCISVVDDPFSGISKALVIAGSDPRGTAFGVFELSRKMGVSPWVYWADVQPETKQALYISGDTVFGPPSVKYRGMFINDEDWGMQPWAAKNMDTSIRPNGKGDIGPRTHEKIFEMMLRTKSNLFWPAMHSCTKAFWFYKQNPEIARRYDIVLGGSHCEMLLRNNEDEWRNNFVTEYGQQPGDYNWNTNKQTLIRYWGDRVKESINNPALYTVGMRGIHDSGIEGYSTDAERKAALEDIIATQRSMLKDSLEKAANTIPQVFCPYKEILPIYNLGLKVPDDIPLLWPDDNMGYIRRLSNPTEQARSGGGGVYFHFSYWGTEKHDYLWLGGTSPAHTSFEMAKAYDLNCKTVWIFNVGDLKPAEFEYQFAMDLAWDVEAWSPEKAYLYPRAWATEIFGPALGNAIGDIKTQYYHLAASGRPEHIYWNTYSIKEMEERITAYEKLAEQAKNIEAQVPARLKDAYYQLIGYPVEASAAMNKKILGARLSFEYVAQHKKDEALSLGYESSKAYQTIQDLTVKYNTGIANGKWNGMMNYAPRGHAYFYDPTVPDEEYIANNTSESTTQDSIQDFQVTGYSAINAAGKNIETIRDLGISAASLTVRPLDLTAYTAGNIASAPYVEYKLPVKKGENSIQVKCFPTFPIYEGKSLRYAISIDGSTPAFVTVGNGLGGGNSLGESARWLVDARRSYTLGETYYKSSSKKEITVRIYFAEPGLVLSNLSVVYPLKEDYTSLLRNPDFEYNASGQQLDGSVVRGEPFGWTRTGTLTGNSWGTNNDAANPHGRNVCWYSSAPMPAQFELSQTVRKAPPGEYILRCKLAVLKDMITTQRLFVNKYVQYYGVDSDYSGNLTAGEINTYAGWSADQGSGLAVNMNEMYIKFILPDSTDLKIGIRSSNKLKGGASATNNAGWFKVDHFRLQLVTDYSKQSPTTRLTELIAEAQELYNSTSEGIYNGNYPAKSRTDLAGAIQTAIEVTKKTPAATSSEQILAIKALETKISDYKKSVVKSTSYIINPNFEYTADGVLSNGALVRGTPYGWGDTGGIVGNSFGTNADASNISGQSVCWYRSAPMPSKFELYQELKGIPAGKYLLKCRMVVSESRMLTTQRLFANNSVQYFGREEDYGANLTAGETNFFACWMPNGSFFMKEMQVEVDVPKDGLLRIGIRSGNTYKNGNNENSIESGWFKVDNFRLEFKEDHGQTGLSEVAKNSNILIAGGKNGFHVHIIDDAVVNGKINFYSLQGVCLGEKLLTENKSFVPVLPGVYVVKIRTAVEEKKQIVLVM